LAVSVDETTTVDIDVVSTELEEGGNILENLLECICLPIVGVIGKLDVALNVEVNMFEVCQIQSSSNHVFGALREYDMSSIVAFVDSVQDVGRVISHSVVVTADIAVSVP